MISAIVRCHTLDFMLDKVLRNLSDIDMVLLAVCNFTNCDVQSKVEEVVKRVNQDNVFVMYFPKMEQKDLFNRCVKILSNLGSDVILINDADEILLRKDRNFIINEMLNNENDHDAVHCSVIDYADMDFLKRFEIRTHKPVVAIKPFVKFDGNRSVGSGKLFNDIILHHFGYAMDKNMLDWKINNLWYRKQSANEILNSGKEVANAPEELRGVM